MLADPQEILVNQDQPAEMTTTDKTNNTTDEAVLRRSNRTRKQPQRYTCDNVEIIPEAIRPGIPQTRSVRRPLFGLHSMMYLLTILLLLLCNTNNAQTLSDQLGPAYLCVTGVEGTLFALGKEPNCTMSSDLPKQVQQTFVKPYFLHAISPQFTL